MSVAPEAEVQAGLPVFISAEGRDTALAAYARLLARWPVAFTELTVPTGFGDVHVLASGPPDAPVIVLLHAYFASAGAWLANVAALSQRFRVYAVDVLGEANRSRPSRPIASEADAVGWMSELLDGLGAKAPILVGNSNGGFLATLLALQRPRRIGGLVLIAPAATIHPIRPFYRHMFAPKLVNLLLPWLPGARRRAERSVRWIRNVVPLDPDWQRLFLLLLLHGSSVTRLFPRVFRAEEWAALAVPALLIIGDREVIYPPAEAIAAARHLEPRIETALVAGANHLAALAQPEAVNALLLAFADRVVERQRQRSAP